MICANDKCGKDFEPRKAGQAQRYCSQRCASRTDAAKRRARIDEGTKERERQKVRDWRDNNRAYTRNKRLQKNFGLTLDDYNRMYEAQHGRCACCQSDMPGGRWNTFAVDHDHATGRIRELLCCKCNQGIGFFDDDVTKLEAAIAYLKRHK